ncbi:Protein of unknown function [Bacillus cereus]|nr:Protein of unknown function [Bacillus cereus]
MGKKLSGRNPV